MLFSTANFAQTDLDAAKFGKTAFEIIKTNNFEKLTTMLLTFDEYKELIRGAVIAGWENERSEDDLKKEFTEYRRNQLAGLKQNLDKAQKEASEMGIIFSNANYLFNTYHIKGLTDAKIGNSRKIKLIFEYLELRYSIKLSGCFYSKERGWLFGGEIESIDNYK